MAEGIHNCFRNKFGVGSREKFLEGRKRLEREAACHGFFLENHRFTVFKLEGVQLFGNFFQLLFCSYDFNGFVREEFVVGLKLQENGREPVDVKKEVFRRDSFESRSRNMDEIDAEAWENFNDGFSDLTCQGGIYEADNDFFRLFFE